ncbi:MAG TPA: hypothetical protein VFV38_48515 [Ktedonobacteraceae bacterium]|nr:hypothetical protein [Ktedonobacteraceae bacterium]
MSLLQKQIASGKSTRGIELAQIALRFLVGGVIFAVVRFANILLLVRAGLPTMNTNLSSELTGVAFGLAVIYGILVTVVLSVLAARLPYRPLVRFLAIFVPFFWIDQGGNILELMFFSTFPVSAVISTWIDTIVETLLLVGVFTWLLPAAEKYRGAPALTTLWRQRPLRSWLWRSLLVAVLYVPTYLTFGSLIYPIVKPYYTNPAYGLQLTTPSLGPFVVLELVRGLLYVVTLLPLLAVTRGSRWQTLFYVFVFTATFNGWQLVVNLTWPAQLRLAHTAEITADVLVQSLLFCWLLTLKFKQRAQSETPGLLVDPGTVPASISQETSG